MHDCSRAAAAEVSALVLGVVIPAALTSAFEPTVITNMGIIRGERDSHDTLVRRGVPYAQPPVGDLRWRAPRPAARA